MKARTFWTVLFLGFLALQFSAATWASDRAGTVSGLFLRISPTPRMAAMGEAFVAEVQGVEAIPYNPGAMPWTRRPEVLFAHADWFADINLEFVGVMIPIEGVGNFGLHSRILYTNDMPVTTPLHPEGTGEFFRASDYAFGLSYARQVSDKFSIGATFKVIQSYLFNLDYGDRVYAIDVGTVYYIGYRNWRMGLTLLNLGTDFRFIQEDYSVPTTFLFGLAGHVLEFGGSPLTLSLQLQRPNDAEERVSLGAEYWIQNLFAFRGGYKLGFDTDTWSVGLGARLNWLGRELLVDYAYNEFKWLPGVHRFSIGLRL